MIWAAISWYPAGPTIARNDRFATSDCVDILGNQGHPVVQKVLPNNDTSFQDYNLPIHTATIVQSWFEKHKNGLQHLPSPAHSPGQNIIEALQSLFQSRLRSRFFIPSSLVKQLELPHEDWYIQYSTRDYSELIRIYSKKGTSRTAGKWWPNSKLINKLVSFTTVSIIFSIPYTPSAYNHFMARGHT